MSQANKAFRHGLTVTAYGQMIVRVYAMLFVIEQQLRLISFYNEIRQELLNDRIGLSGRLVGRIYLSNALVCATTILWEQVIAALETQGNVKGIAETLHRDWIAHTNADLWRVADGTPAAVQGDQSFDREATLSINETCKVSQFHIGHGHSSSSLYSQSQYKERNASESRTHSGRTKSSLEQCRRIRMLACLSGTENLGHVKPSLNTGNPTVLRGIRGKGPKGWLAAETEREGRRKTDATVRSVAMAKLQSQAEMTWPLKQAA